MTDKGFAPDFPPTFLSGTGPTGPPPVGINEIDRWTLQVRDGFRQWRADVVDYTQCVMTPQWGGVGTWSLTMPRDCRAARFMLANPQTGLIAKRDEQIVFSGPTRGRNRRFDGTKKTVTFTGYDDLQLVKDRLAMPEPATAAPPYGKQAFDTRAGTASSVMYAYVNANAAANALSPRQQVGLVLDTDPIAGSDVTGNGRYQTLDVLLEQLGTTSVPEIGFRAVQTTNGQVLFSASASVDKSATIVFSVENGTVVAYEIDEAAGTNYIVGGGSGSLLERGIREGANGPSEAKWGRIEGFGDHSDAETSHEIDQAVAADLAKQTDQWSIDLTLSSAAASRWRASNGWDLGDKVTVDVDGDRWVDVIREVAITLEKDTVTIQPHVETNGGREVRLGLALASSLRQTQDTTSTLSRLGVPVIGGQG